MPLGTCCLFRAIQQEQLNLVECYLTFSDRTQASTTPIQVPLKEGNGEQITVLPRYVSIRAS